MLNRRKFPLKDLTQAKHDESDQNTISSEMSEITANLKSYFKKRVCFLLPSPGPVVTRKDFNGDLRELDTNFVEHCKLFFRMTTDDIEAIFQDKHLLNRGFQSGQQLYDLFKVIQKQNLFIYGIHLFIWLI